MFGENLRKLREERKMTQQETAQIFGLKQRTYSNYEKGITEPPYKTLIHIADYYRVSTDFLLGRYENKSSQD